MIPKLMLGCLLVPAVFIDPPRPTKAALTPAIAGPAQVGRDQLVRLTVAGVPDRSALLWRVYPPEKVDRATTAKARLEFAAPPGDYRVELLVVTVAPDGTPEVAELFHKVTVDAGGVSPPPPPQPPKGDPAAAIVRIQFGNAGCTACPIGPRRPDGRWDVMTAAHCVTGVGQRGTMHLADGRRVAVTVAARDARSDVCWLVTDAAVEDVPHAELAESLPARGTRVWHKGFGVDRPGNREEGTVLGETTDGQLAIEMSVSSGDSGGPIVLNEAGQVVACVCCTTGLAVRATMYGGHALSARAVRPRPNAADDWTPLPMPMVKPKPTRQ